MQRERSDIPDTTEAEKQFFGKPLEKTQPVQEVRRAQPTAAEVAARRIAREQRQMSEAEMRVQAWIDAGMKPAEREHGLEMLIEDLEEAYEKIGSEDDPSKDKSVESINRRSEDALEELNNAKAELTVLRRRLAEMKKTESFPTLPETDLEPLPVEEEPMDPDKPLGTMSGEVVMHFPPRQEPTAQMPRAIAPVRRSPVLHSASDLSISESRIPQTPRVAEQPQKTTRESNSFVDRARGAWNRFTNWWGAKEEAPKPTVAPSYDEKGYREKESAFKAKQASRAKAERARMAAGKAKVGRYGEIKAQREAESKLVESMMKRDKEALRLQKILADNPGMLAGNRKRLESQLAARRESIAADLRRNRSQESIAAK